MCEKQRFLQRFDYIAGIPLFRVAYDMYEEYVYVFGKR